MNIQIQSKNLMQCIIAAFVAAVLTFSFCPRAHAKPDPPQNSMGQLASPNGNGVASLEIDLQWKGEWLKVTGRDLTVWVSQRMILRARMSDGSAISNPSWNVPGNAFAKYIPKTTKTRPVPLTVLNENSVSFIWRDKGDALNVRFKGMSRGAEVSRGVNFRVRRPEVTLTTYTDGVNWNNGTGLQIGDWGGSVKNPDPEVGRRTAPPEGVVAVANRDVHWPDGGMLRFTQVITYYRHYQYDADLIHGRKIITTGLDTGVNYGDTFSSPGAHFGMSDAPQSGHRGGDIDHRIELDIKFTTWLMFKTKDSNSQWVPLKSFDWKGGGKADKNPDGTWTVSNKYAQSFASMETTKFPIWDGLAKAGPYDNSWVAF